jgi:hypothetical protein
LTAPPNDGKFYAIRNGVFVEIDVAPPPAFAIAAFSNNSPINERGVPVTAITFNWGYSNGEPTEQSISPLVGAINNSLRTATLTGQNISTNTTFTLNATDGDTIVNRTSQLSFFAPVFFGSVLNASPTESEIRAMQKRVNPFTNFNANLGVIANARSCVASPMTNPITDIRDLTLNVSLLSTFTAIDNVMVQMADSTVVAYKVWVKNTAEDSFGLDMVVGVNF